MSEMTPIEVMTEYAGVRGFHGKAGRARAEWLATHIESLAAAGETEVAGFVDWLCREYAYAAHMAATVREGGRR